MENKQDAAALFARISKDLMQEQEESTTFERVARRAVEVVPACDHAGITMRERRHRTATVASTSALAEACDQLQYDLADLAHDPRWPRWGPEAAARGIERRAGHPDAALRHLRGTGVRGAASLLEPREHQGP